MLRGDVDMNMKDLSGFQMGDLFQVNDGEQIAWALHTSMNLEKKYAGEGRVLIRPSGTEPLGRVMIEGKDINVIKEDAEMLAKLIQDIMF